MIVDGKGQVLGRLASKVAERLLDGEEVKVTNCGEIIITGSPESTVKKYLEEKKIGDPHHGPYSPNKPEGIFRRTVRGMVPIKKARGKKAFKKLKTYRNNPLEDEGEKIGKDKEEVKTNYITLEELSNRIGE